MMVPNRRFLWQFQSAPLLRGAMLARSAGADSAAVSIRAPLARGDQPISSVHRSRSCFNPRPSCEGRYQRLGCLACADQFQSAPLLRGAIAFWSFGQVSSMFQSAPLLRGAITAGRAWLSHKLFQSAPLLRGAIGQLLPHGGLLLFQSAPLLRGAIISFITADKDKTSFNPRPSCEGRSRTAQGAMRVHRFQSAPLLRGAIRRPCAASRSRGVSIRAPLARGDFFLGIVLGC